MFLIKYSIFEEFYTNFGWKFESEKFFTTQISNKKIFFKILIVDF